MSGRERPIVVFAGDSHWHGHRLAAQYIAEHLTRYARVLYVDPPLSPVGLRRLRQRYPVGRWVGIEAIDPPALHRVGALVPPGKTRRGGRYLAERALRTQIRRAVRRLGGPVHATIQVPVHHPVLGSFDEPHRVHLASDDFVAAADLHGVDARWVRRCEQRIARVASTVVAVTPSLEERWRGHGFDPVVIPNGCDVALYSTTDDVSPAADVVLPPPVAGFVGTISERTDVALLEAVAARGRSLLLVGPRSFTAPGRALDALFDRPNVQWVGPKDHRELPGYLRHVKVGLVPYRVDAFSLASFPLKTLDYLAAGRAVVSTDLPAVDVVGTDLVAVASDPQGFADAVDQLLDAADGSDLVARRRARASAHSWEARVQELAAVIGLGPGDAA